MNEALISNFNEIVGPHDMVFHLGDFAFDREPEKYFNRLNGNIHLVLGNHDNPRFLRNCQFVWMRDVYYLRDGNDRFWLSHYAHLRWPKSHHGAYHLFGHSHGELMGCGRSMDVGVDAQNYYPIHIDDVIQKLNSIGPTPHHGED
jgi:calcineurin-like phosphoesterase family protein